MAAPGTTNFEPPRTEKRLRLVLDLARAPEPDAADCRAVAETDREQLAELMLDAYRDTIDYNGETLADARKEVEETIAGAYGRFLPDCSFVAPAPAGLAAATLVTLLDPDGPDQAPLLAFVMTRKDCQGRGLAGSLIRRTARALLHSGHSRLRLAVTAANAPACRLYARLGFVAPDPASR
jgi:GNAT superfamily N-acetyltransferase